MQEGKLITTMVSSKLHSAFTYSFTHLLIKLQVEKFQPSDKLFKKYASKICLEKFEGLQGYSGSVTNKMVESQRRAENERQVERVYYWQRGVGNVAIYKK